MEENKLDKRSIARIQAMKIIYIADFNGISIDSSLTMGKSGFFNDNIAGEDPISEETIELLKYVTENLEKIDGIIKETITNYSKLSLGNLIQLFYCCFRRYYHRG